MDHPHFRVPSDRRHPSDPVYEAPKPLHEDFPESVDLRTVATAQEWPVWDRGTMPSCTAHAVAGVAMFEMIVARRTPLFQPSRLFIYYGERVIEGDPQSESDCIVRHGVRVVLDEGVCADAPTAGVPDDAVWPYDFDPNTVTKRPPAACYEFARTARAARATHVIESLPHLRGCLVEGHPFTICIRVFESINSAAHTGDIPMPSDEERKEGPVGGHAMVVCGYHERTRKFIVRNLKTDWGQGGYGTIPYEYALDGSLSDSFWTMRYAAV